MIKLGSRIKLIGSNAFSSCWKYSQTQKPTKRPSDRKKGTKNLTEVHPSVVPPVNTIGLVSIELFLVCLYYSLVNPRMKRQRLIVKIDAPTISIRWNLVNLLLCLTVDPQAIVKNPTPEAANARIARNRKSHLQLELPSSKRPPLRRMLGVRFEAMMACL